MATRKQAATVDWLTTLRNVVSDKPIVVFRFSQDDWSSLLESRRGTSTFTIAQSHALLRNVRTPTACILIGDDRLGNTRAIHFGNLRSKSSITTLQSRVKITNAQSISPSTEEGLLGLLTNKSLKPILRARLNDVASLTRLSPALSVHLVEKLAQLPVNRHVMRAVSESLSAPAKYSNNLSVQDDAISLALKAFGLARGDPAALVEIVDRDDTALTHVSIREDAVIEHDARMIPGFVLSKSDLTGRAVFRNGNQILEIVTANKRPLEEVLGVDLIYLNAVRRNIVMVQYKMLERDRSDGEDDWLYRPDRQLKKELARMKLFSKSHAPGPLEYRINPQVYYLRFVRREATLGQSAVTIPVDHFEILSRDPSCKGSKGAFRISYNTLNGRYMRQEGFLDLVNSGYIGAYAETTKDLIALIEATLDSDRAVVAAVQSALQHTSRS